MNTQPEALRLAEILDSYALGNEYQRVTEDAAAELRRLHQTEREGWRYADELEKERKRLNRVNQELVEALEEVVRVFESNPSSISDTVWVTGMVSETLYDYCQAALTKARGTE